MGILNDCETCFKTTDIYSILGIKKNAPEGEIKKAYKKLSLLCHPDRVSDELKEEATKKFQTLSKIHSILSDKEKRIIYDETGCIDEEDGNLNDRDWENYWRLLFPRITKKDICDFMENYKGSKEELEDLKRCYCLYEGDMNKISEGFIGYDVDEEDKIRETLKELIQNEEIPSFPKFYNEKKSSRENRRKKFKKEAEEAASVEKEMDDSLAKAIMKNSARRENQFDDMIKNLESKYASKGANKKKKK